VPESLKDGEKSKRWQLQLLSVTGDGRMALEKEYLFDELIEHYGQRPKVFFSLDGKCIWFFNTRKDYTILNSETLEILKEGVLPILLDLENLTSMAYIQNEEIVFKQTFREPESKIVLFSGSSRFYIEGTSHKYIVNTEPQADPQVVLEIDSELVITGSNESKYKILQILVSESDGEENLRVLVKETLLDKSIRAHIVKAAVGTDFTKAETFEAPLYSSKALKGD
jgi:hypothetical protein